MFILLTIIAIFAGYLLFNRYIPVRGVKRLNGMDVNFEEVKVIDLRDYNDSYQSPINGAMNIPVAYLNRFYRQIPKGNLLVVASNELEKNVGIRALRQKGFQVIGYTIFEQEKFIHMKERDQWNTMLK